MSLELLTKAVEEHGVAVKSMGAKTVEALEGIKQLGGAYVRPRAVDIKRRRVPPR